MAVLKFHVNERALTSTDKKIIADFINANMGQFLYYCGQQGCSVEQIDRLMYFTENNAAPFENNVVDVDV
ncbi:TPA: hypothetical protein WI014_001269 [Neisseria meningitidis]